MNYSTYIVLVGACFLGLGCSEDGERDASVLDARADVGVAADAQAPDASAPDAAVEDTGVVEDLAQRLRDLFGLNAGSCYRFRTSATEEAEIVADQYWRYTRGATTGEEELVVGAGRVHLERSARLSPITGGRKGPEIRFTNGGPLLIMTAVWPLQPGQADSSPGGFAGEVTIMGGLRSEDGLAFPSRAYRSSASAIEAARHDGTRSSAIRLDVTEEGAPFWSADLIPSYGPARFVDRQGVVHDVCDARVCDRDGVCAGAADCAQLTCP